MLLLNDEQKVFRKRLEIIKRRVEDDRRKEDVKDSKQIIPPPEKIVLIRNTDIN